MILRRAVRGIACHLLALALMGLAPVMAHAENGASEAEWHHYGGDPGSHKYSKADRINKDNVDRLELTWRWKSPDTDLKAPAMIMAFKATPLMVGGVLYLSTSLGQIVALDPASGVEKWRYNPEAYTRGRPPHGGFSSRGVEYWTDGEEERILFGSGTLQLIALDAKTGELCADFGTGGIVDMREGLGREINPRNIGLNSPPIVCRDTIVVGSVVNDFGNSKRLPPGHVRGYDVRTGEMKWIFHTIPQGTEFGVETWEDGAWEYTGNTNVWTLLSADEELGYVYLPIGTPTNDHYGGHRLGDNLFAESLVCLNAETGERVWHFQAVHHGIWDYDFPCAPNLMDIEVDGRKIKAVAQASKQGFTYVFDRVTGEPVWPIEEKAVPQSTIPGERPAPTQPYPTKPAAFERQTLGTDDLIDFTPELRAEAEAILSEYVVGPMFTPPIVQDADGKKALIQIPGMAGGANWGGAAADPETGMLYIVSQTRPFAMALREMDQERFNMRYNRGGARVSGPQGLPLTKPPYSRVTAIDMNTGEHAWQVPLGDGPRDHPALKDLDLGRLGTSSMAGLSPGYPLSTPTLLFVAQSVAPGGSASPIGGGGGTGYLRAYDKATGELVSEKIVEGSIQAAPMTYIHHGRQYVVMAVGERGPENELLAYTLP